MSGPAETWNAILLVLLLAVLAVGFATAFRMVLQQRARPPAPLSVQARLAAEAKVRFRRRIVSRLALAAGGLGLVAALMQAAVAPDVAEVRAPAAVGVLALVSIALGVLLAKAA